GCQSRQPWPSSSQVRSRDGRRLLTAVLLQQYTMDGRSIGCGMPKPKVLGPLAASIGRTIRQFFRGRAPLGPCTIAPKNMDAAADGSRAEVQEVTSVGLR